MGIESKLGNSDPSELKELLKSYTTEFAGILQSYISELESVGLDRLSYEPEYTINTSKGEIIKIKIVSNERRVLDIDDNDIGLEKIFYMFAFDSDGNPVGERRAALFFSNEGITLDGTITVGKKNMGYAVAIDTVMLDLVRREPQVKGQLINWNLFNINEDRTRKLQKAGTPQNVIEQQITEQKRWLAAYGPQGKFKTVPVSRKETGFDFKKVIPPLTDHQPPLGSIDSVALERDPQSEFGKVVGIQMSDPKDLRKKRIEEFEIFSKSVNKTVKM